MRALEFITGHVIYNPAYTYKFQLKTTNNKLGREFKKRNKCSLPGNYFKILRYSVCTTRTI